MALAFEKLLGFFVMLTGLVVMGIWLFDQNLLNALNPNTIMLFNTALCLTVAGLAIIIPHSSPLLRTRIQTGAGFFLLVAGGLMLLQHIINASIGIDQMFVNVMVDDYRPNPGRTSPPTALCFMLFGCILALLHDGRKTWVNITILTLTLLIMAISIMGVSATSVRFELLYDWYKYGRMAMPTAACLLMLSVSLWLGWYRRETQEGGYLENQERRIRITGIVIISMVAMSAGMSGFGIMARQTEHTLQVSLRETHNNQLQLIENNIHLGVSAAMPISRRLLLNRYLAVFDENSDNQLARQVIHEDVESFRSASFPYVAIYAKSGQLITDSGEATHQPGIRIPLQLKGVARAELLWKDMAILRLTIDITSKDEIMGSAVVERTLPYIGDFLLKKEYLGDTEETRICYAHDHDIMQCLPSNRHFSVFPPEVRVRGHESTSMDLALKNQNGIRNAHDYLGHQVVSAYGPISDLGLGLVVKIDAAEFYAPIRERLEYAIGLVMLLSVIAITVQHMQLIPLVTRLIASEERVTIINQFQQTLLDSANFTIIACDNEGIIQVFNKTAERMLGYSAEEVVGKKTPRIFHDPELIRKRATQLSVELGREIAPGMETFIAKARINGSDENEWIYTRKDGTSYPVLLSVSCLYNAAGEVTGSLGLGLDITERKRLEKLKNEFISTVSHELRTPLTSIRGSLGLMRAGIVGEMAPKAKEMTEIAYKNSERLIFLINDILDIEKIESGEMRFDIREENLENLMQQAVEANAAYGEKFEVRFTVEPIHPSVTVRVDANRLIQVLSNLLSNAAKFSSPGDEVAVRLYRQDDRAFVSVTDKGPGIPENFRSQIFKKFAQADSSSTRQKAGTGLGLNISKQIMESMNGTIDFTSGIGEGTTFRISLPELFKPISGAQLEEAIEYLSTENFCFLPRILHAEDNYDLCRIIAHALQGKAIVHVAATVADAATLLRANTYDLLVLDISLPDGTGLRLLQQIEEEKLSTKVMILSAREVDEKVRRKVALAMVKSTVSEDRIVENILSLVKKASNPDDEEEV